MLIRVDDSLESSRNILNQYEAKLLSGESLEDSYLLIFIPPTEEYVKLNKYTVNNIIGTEEKDSVAVNNSNAAYVYFFKNTFKAADINDQFPLYKNIIDINIESFFKVFNDYISKKEDQEPITYQEEVACFINSLAFKRSASKKTPFGTQNMIGNSILLEGSRMGNSILGNEDYQYIVGITSNMQYLIDTVDLKILVCCIVDILEKSLQKTVISKESLLEIFNLYMHKFVS